MGKLEGRRPLRRARSRWEDNIKFKRFDGDIEWINLTQDKDRWRALVNTVMNLRVLEYSGNSLSSLGRFSFSGRTLLHGVSTFTCAQCDFFNSSGGKCLS